MVSDIAIHWGESFEKGRCRGRGAGYIDMIGLCKAKVYLSKSLPKLDITKFKGRLSPLN